MCAVQLFVYKYRYIDSAYSVYIVSEPSSRDSRPVSKEYIFSFKKKSFKT